jgi:serine/threonine-protein kinase RsbW
MSPRRFQMPNRIDDVDPMVMTLASEVDDLLAPEARFRFELSVSEALTNLVLHGKTDVDDAVIDICLVPESDSVSVEIFDPTGATPFDIRAHAPELSELEPLLEGGRGLGLIMDCADAVDYSAAGSQHRLKLTFRPRPL